jgi:hypothetical protein
MASLATVTRQWQQSEVYKDGDQQRVNILIPHIMKITKLL